MQYQVIFDVTQSGYRDWSYPAFGLPFVLVGLFWVCFRKVLIRKGMTRRPGPSGVLEKASPFFFSASRFFGRLAPSLRRTDSMFGSVMH